MKLKIKIKWHKKPTFEQLKKRLDEMSENPQYIRTWFAPSYRNIPGEN